MTALLNHDTGLFNKNTVAVAIDLASELFPPNEVCKRHNLTTAELKQLLKDPQFRHQYREYKSKWNAPMSTLERIRLKSAVAVEDSIAALHAMFHNSNMLPSARIDAFKQLVVLSETAPKAKDSNAGGAFQLTIQLADGSQPQSLVIDHDDAQSSDDTVAEPISTQAKLSGSQ